MDIKKKLGIGVLTGALGLSLVGGGTWAAFNDVEETTNVFAAGVLDLEIGEESTIDFQLDNLKPGDYWTETLHLKNSGSLDINQILTTIEVTGWEDVDALDLNSKVYDGAGNNKLSDFLNQFKVTVFQGESQVWSGYLNQLRGLNNTDITGTTDEQVGLPVGGDMPYEIKFEFENVDQTFEGSRFQVQNKYQDEQAEIKVKFEATQMPGEEQSNGIANY